MPRRTGCRSLKPLTDEAFGQRHFITRDPNGVLIDVITPIPPAPEYAGLFAEHATTPAVRLAEGPAHR